MVLGVLILKHFRVLSEKDGQKKQRHYRHRQLKRRVKLPQALEILVHGELLYDTFCYDSIHLNYLDSQSGSCMVHLWNV